MNFPRSFLTTLAELQSSLAHSSPCSTYSFLMAHGVEFAGAKRPADIPKGKRHQCFANAAKLAMARHDLAYCEGYASGVLPVHHAWCVTEAGVVVDPTWPDAERCQYFGAMFKTQFMVMRLASQGIYGLLDNWKEHFPIESGLYPESQWKHTLTPAPAVASVA